MSRNLKALGLALIAVLALSAVAAGVAHAETPIESELASPAVTTLDANDVTGTEDGKLARLTIGAGARFIECTTAKQWTNATITGSATTVTATPNYENCFSNGLKTVPVTVTHNGCTLTMTVKKESAGKIPGDVTIDCPAGKHIEIHVYENVAAHIEKKSICTYTIKGGQTLTGGGVTTALFGNAREYILNLSTLSQVTVTNDGPAGLAACSVAVGGEAKASFTGKITVTGTNSGGVQVGVFLG